MRTLRVVGALSGVAAVCAMQGCSSSAPSESGSFIAAASEAVKAAREQETIYSAKVVDGVVVSSSTATIPASAYGTAPPQPPKGGDKPLPPAATKKIDDLLEAHVKRGEANNKGSERVNVVVTFAESQQVARLPDINEKEPLDSVTNQAALQRIGAAITQLEQARAPEHAKHAAELASQHGASVRDQFWLINGMVLDLPLNQVRALSARADVSYVEQATKDIPPPANNSVDARNLMWTDPYYSGFSTGRVGLLDTGVRATHTLFNSPSRLGVRRDCVNGTSNNCATGTNLDPSDNNWNHGTLSASELSANSNLGNNNRGVTSITVDSFKIYTAAGLAVDASVRGFQAALATGDRVIVAEIQDTGGTIGAISTAANSAYDSGAVIVAAAGNYGPGDYSVRAPGNARKVLAVGAADVMSLALMDYSGRGPTTDNGRTKPDILGPTNVYAASNASDTALGLFQGTSAATPNAAAATALMRNVLRGSNSTVAPGQVYAMMLAGGDNESDAPYNNAIGAGMIKLEAQAWLHWGSVNLTSGSTIDIPLNLSVPGNLNAAIWWADPSQTQHNDVDLELYNPSGGFVTFSGSGASIFEKLNAWGGGVSGIWKLRIRAYLVTGTQRVFWAMTTPPT
jgi:serine protease AprX